MLQTIEVEIDASGRIHLIEPCNHLPPGRALLTLLQPTPSARERLECGVETPDNHAGAPLGMDNRSSILSLLRSPLFREAPLGVPAALEATIQANRDAWDE